MYYAYYPSVRALIEELTIGLERQVAVGLTSTKVNNQEVHSIRQTVSYSSS